MLKNTSIIVVVVHVCLATLFPAVLEVQDPARLTLVSDHDLKNYFILNLTVLILFLLTKVKNGISLLQCSLNCCIQTIKGPVPQYQLNEFAFLYKYAFKMTLTL
jgi:hypothetical protein